jgi:hypothetical protein
MRHLLGFVLAALALQPIATLALTVHVTPTQLLDVAPSTNESLAQRWTVAPSASGEQIQSLEIDSFAQVFISYEPQDTTDAALPLVATVLVSGSDFKLITTADVVALAPATLTIRLLDASQLDGIDGFVGVHVILHQQHVVQRVHATGEGDVVITDSVLVENDPHANVSVDARGGTRVYLPSHVNLTANSVSLSTSGSASVYLPTASRIQAPSVSLLQSGSGAIAATSSALQVLHTLAVASSGAGSVCIDATFIETNVIRVDASSAGDVYVGGHDGSYEATNHYFCDASQVFQSGPGAVDLGTILCIDSDVEIDGSGDVTVSSARSLAGHARGKGKILYAGEMPIDILPVDPWARVTQPIAHPVESYSPRTCSVPSAPARRLSRIAGRTSRRVITPTHVGVVALLALCIGAVYAVESRRQRLARQRRTDERTPLLSQGRQ